MVPWTQEDQGRPSFLLLALPWLYFLPLNPHPGLAGNESHMLCPEGAHGQVAQCPPIRKGSWSARPGPRSPDPHTPRSAHLEGGGGACLTAGTQNNSRACELDADMADRPPSPSGSLLSEVNSEKPRGWGIKQHNVRESKQIN